MGCEESSELNVQIYPTGEILWVPACYIVDMCELPLEEYPDANQNCTIKVCRAIILCVFFCGLSVLSEIVKFFLFA